MCSVTKTGQGSTNWQILSKRSDFTSEVFGRLLESYRRTVFEAITERNMILKNKIKLKNLEVKNTIFNRGIALH